MPALEALKDLDLATATVSLWVFKKSTHPGRPPSFTGRWIDAGDLLIPALKETIDRERSHIEEVHEYSLLAQANESSALSLGTDETHAALIVEQVTAEIQPKKVRRVKELRNASFYVVKVVSSDDQVIHAVAKTAGSWKTKRRIDTMSALFTDQGLDLDTAERFDLSKTVDFFIVGDTILANHKGRFESILSYKLTHQNDFVELQSEADFGSIFSSFESLIEHVGQNKIHLRRMSAIRQKGHYRNPGFMQNLRAHYVQFGLNLLFDDDGKLIATPETCGDVIRALLDHRLMSPFSSNTYDVPDATPIAVAG